MKYIKKMKYIMFAIVLLFPLNVFADTCSQDVTNKLYNQVQNIKYNLIHIGNNEFNINFSNVPNNIKICNEVGTIYDNSIILKGGNTYKLYFIVDNLNCNLNITLTKNIYVNKYNIYADRDECQKEENSNFKYCNPNYQGTITDENFNLELKKYNEDNIIEEVDQEDIIENNFIKNNIYIIYIGIVVLSITLLVTLIIIKNKKRRKNKL